MSFLADSRLAIAVAAVALTLTGCAGPADSRVVVYTALDDMYSRPILDRFAETTGIEVVPVYDTEASKTTGLVNRLIAETATELMRTGTDAGVRPVRLIGVSVSQLESPEGPDQLWLDLK